MELKNFISTEVLLPFVFNKHFGLFVYLIVDYEDYQKGLYFGGINGWEKLNNDISSGTDINYRLFTRFSIKEKSYDIKLSDKYSLPLTTATYDGSITYESSDETIATVSESGDYLNLLKTGTVTITAYITDTPNTIYVNSSDTFTLTITDMTSCYWGFYPSWYDDFKYEGSDNNENNMLKTLFYNNKLPDKKISTTLDSFVVSSVSFEKEFGNNDGLGYETFWFAIPSGTDIKTFELGSEINSTNFIVKNGDVGIDINTDDNLNINGYDIYAMKDEGSKSPFDNYGLTVNIIK